MAINVAGALSAYANAQRMTGAATAAPAAGGESFGKLLENAASGVVTTLDKGEQASLRAVAGNADLTAVTQAVTDAEVALQTVVAVRDRVISAYQSIIQMPI